VPILVGMRRRSGKRTYKTKRACAYTRRGGEASGGKKNPKDMGGKFLISSGKKKISNKHQAYLGEKLKKLLGQPRTAITCPPKGGGKKS